MEQFLSLVLSFPTVPLTVAMGVVLLYWLFVILGVAGHDLFDGAADAVTGGAKSAGEAAAGAAKALGAAKAVGADGHSHDASDGDGGGMLDALGLGKVPITITFSSVTFFSWLGSLLLRRWVDSGGWLLGTGVLLGCVVVSLLVTSLVLKPVAKVFEPARAATRKDVVGHICTITSGKVDGGFGTASLADGGPGLLLHVVCAKANQLKEGDQAVVVEWNEAAQAFDVEPVDWLLPQELEALSDPTRAASVISSRVKAR